jgi:guanine deaminase
MNPEFMRQAVAEARRGMKKGDGGPFGAVIVRGGEIVARGHNRVIVSHDPTAHAEIVAIRRATRRFGRFDLSDCELYTTCEPCPMCLAAIHWARIKRFYFGCTTDDAARIGFDDKAFYDSFRGIGCPCFEAVPLLRDECRPLFETWAAAPSKKYY